MSQRVDMYRELKTHVLPALRVRGFAGTLPHLRRLHSAKTDLLTFQFDRHGGGFVIELAEGPVGQLVRRHGVVPAARMKAYDMYPPDRKRLQPLVGSGSTDSWFRYDGAMTPEQVAKQVLAFLSEIDAWFSGRKDQPHIR